MNIREAGLKGLLWNIAGRYSAIAIIFLVGIILARLLLPADYGLVGMLNIFLAISSSFIDSGFNAALIQKKEPTEEDFSTVFFFNLAVAVGLYLLLYFLAPYIAAFYHAPLLTEITRVVSFSLIINGLYIVQRTVLTKRVDFKTQTKVTVPASLIAGAAAIFLAYKGFGPWALVANILLSALYTCLAMWRFCHFSPKLCFSLKSFKELFSFGGKVLASGLLTNIYNNLHSLIIGRAFNQTQLGYFSKANSFATLPSYNLSVALSNVTMPIYSKLQDDDQALRAEALHYLAYSTFLIFPMMLGLAAVAKPLIVILLTEKWLATAPLLTILCFGYMWHHLQTIAQNVMLAKGFSGQTLAMEIIRRALGITLLFAALPFGITAICLAFAISYFAAFILGLIFAQKTVSFSIKEQLKLIGPIFLNSLIMFLAVLGLEKLIDSPMLQLIVGVLSGIILYSSLAFVLTPKLAKNCLNFVGKKPKV